MYSNLIKSVAKNLKDVSKSFDFEFMCKTRQMYLILLIMFSFKES